LPSGDGYWKTRASGTACSDCASAATLVGASAALLAGVCRTGVAPGGRSSTTIDGVDGCCGERSDLGRRRGTLSGSRPRNRLRLRANAACAARPRGESLLELTFQTLGRDVMFGLDLRRDLDPDLRGLEADDLDVVGHVLPVGMVVALALFKRVLTRSPPSNQAHRLIIAELGNRLRQYEHDVRAAKARPESDASSRRVSRRSGKFTQALGRSL
jgi:hypothetical protein